VEKAAKPAIFVNQQLQATAVFATTYAATGGVGQIVPGTVRRNNCVCGNWACVRRSKKLLSIRFVS
jgi:hypothetical protein